MLYDPRLKEGSFQSVRERFRIIDTLSECKGSDYLVSPAYAFLNDSQQREYFEQEFKKENKLSADFTFEKIKPIIHSNIIVARENIESNIKKVMEYLKKAQAPDTGGWDFISKEDLLKILPTRKDEIKSLQRPRFSNAWTVATCIRALLKWRAYMSDDSVDPYIKKGLGWLRKNKACELHDTFIEGLDSLPAELGPSSIKIYDTSYGLLAFLYAPPEAGGASMESVPYLDTVIRYFSLEDRCWLLNSRPDVGATSYSLYTLIRYYEKCTRPEEDRSRCKYLSDVERLINDGAKWLLENRVKEGWSNSISPERPRVDKTCLAANALIKYCELFQCDDKYFDAVENAVEFVSRNFFFTSEGKDRGWAWLDANNKPDIYMTTLALNMLFKYSGDTNLPHIKHGTIWVLNQWQAENGKNEHDNKEGNSGQIPEIHPMDKVYILCSVLDYLHCRYGRGKQI
ncbi:hypothetical protein KKG29_05485 [Patescibacteria group bacterium]|nr:hypothetical protein [Patescibacteria group bacterium]